MVVHNRKLVGDCSSRPATETHVLFLPSFVVKKCHHRRFFFFFSALPCNKFPFFKSFVFIARHFWGGGQTSAHCLTASVIFSPSVPRPESPTRHAGRAHNVVEMKKKKKKNKRNGAVPVGDTIAMEKIHGAHTHKKFFDFFLEF